ncbi:M61 family metallopeptidase [Arsenicibacter rosenii]|uniref:Peptidase M61 n=1 Tax=Arsenicibacter rosenii TaxID=1750698 RepID=A0A1S2VBC0_9BACT|nr:M61 family metallopeptidase [Arsenicibacter rosenii]OIN56024.1 peptidase M61 [Arsenicibacter rosenii]
MHYILSADPQLPHYIAVDAYLRDITTDTVELQLPAWRPGRYELQHFARNIQRFAIYDQAGHPVPFRKITKDRWLVQTKGITSLVVRYNYFTSIINAGTSFISDTLLYVNPVNLCVYAEGRIDEPCSLTLAIPDEWPVACGLKPSGEKQLWASDFYELIDSPLIAAPDLQRIDYTVGEVPFTVWFQGNIVPDHERIIDDFSRFSAAQLDLFGEFPEADYHFLTIVLPTAYYHGVEHRNSTMLVLGPDDEGEGLYIDLLGVSSHELFHAWNIIRIRPQELLPYDLTRENYFQTCFVAEGVTTYYGDLLLRRAGVFPDAAYLKELQVTFKRHFDVSDRAFQSLTESSWDLWLDGYDKGVPDRKVSVYHKGAIAALILDLHIRQVTNHRRSLDDVMRLMWERYGKPFIGYSYADYQAVTEEVAGQSLEWYYTLCIEGNTSLLPTLNQYLGFVGLQIIHDENGGVVLEVVPDDLIGTLNRRKWWGID